MNGCICKCGCGRERSPDCNNLCERCWRQWCEGSGEHAPIADNSYVGTYGITNPWTGWIMGQAPHLVAETPAMLLRPEAPPARGVEVLSPRGAGHHLLGQAGEIRFIRGRLKFSGHKNSAPFPSCIVVFRGRHA